MSQIHAVNVRFALTGVWGAKENNEQVANEIHLSNGAAKDAGTYKADLFPESAVGADNPHKRWVSAAWKLRAYHYKWTLPWEKPLRLVTAAFHEEYDRETTRLWEEANRCAQEFFEWYASRDEYNPRNWWYRVRQAHNGGFKEDLYRDPVKLRAKFSFEKTYSPVPEEHHFLKSMVGPAIERARQEFEARNQRLAEDAITYAWTEVLGPVLRLAERLTEPEALIREDVVAGIRETLERVPALNLTNDGRLRDAAEAVRVALLGVTAAGLRDSPVQRLETARATMGVLQRFGQMGGRKFAA